MTVDDQPKGGPAAADRSLPAKLPASALLSAITDAAAVDLLREDGELRAARSSLSAQLRAVQDSADRALRELRPKTSGHRNEVNSAIADVMKRRDALYRRLDELRMQQSAASQVIGELRALGFTQSGLRREIRDTEMILRDEQRELDSLKKGDAAGRAAALHKRIEKLSSVLQDKTQELERVEAEQARCRAALDDNAPQTSVEERDAMFVRIRRELNSTQEELEVLKRKRAVRPDDSAVVALREQQAALRRELADTDARLDALRRDSSLYTHFTYPAAHRMEIVGRGGATLRQLQIDFGVALCIDAVPPGHGFVIGGADAVQQCIAAIDELVAAAGAEEACRASVSFPPALKPTLIGTRGATIAGFERDSGARLSLGDDAVEITGSADAVEAAKELLEDFVDHHGEAEMPVAAAKASQVIGKGGATIARVERESGVRSLRLERHRGVLRATGTAAAIAAAFKMVREILGDADGGAVTVHGDVNLARAVIGVRGRTVREIEAATGASVQCGKDNAIHITGAPAAVEAARLRVEELRRAETRVEADHRQMNFLTAPIVRAESGDAGPSTPAMLSPLEAVQRATGCDQVLAFRAEGAVVMRGKPALAQRAATMVQQLLLRNAATERRVTFPEVLRGFLMRRQTAERGSSLLDQLARRYSALLRVDVDRASSALNVSSYDPEEAQAAAAELADLLETVAARQMRVLDDFPERRLGQLIGPGGSTIRELQDATATEIAVVREARQVQIFSATSDAAALDGAVEEIRSRFLEEAPNDDAPPTE